MEKPITMADIAVQYSEAGFKVYPTIPGKKIPHAGSRGENDATDNPDEVRALFTKYNVNSNIAISLKGTDLIILDCDNHTPSKSGHASLEKLEASYEPLPPTYTIRTPSGGSHYYFRTPGISLNKDIQDLLPGLDVMATKIMAVPSRSINNNGELVGSYTEQSGLITEIANIPKWFLDYLSNNYQKKQRSDEGFNINYTFRHGDGKGKTIQLLEEVVQGIGKGGRNSFFTRAIGTLLKANMSIEAAIALMIDWNDHYTKPPLSSAELHAVIKSVVSRENKKRKE